MVLIWKSCECVMFGDIEEYLSYRRCLTEAHNSIIQMQDCHFFHFLHVWIADKADMDVESFNDGILGAIVTQEGEVANVGDAIAYIAESDADVEAAKAKAGGSGKFVHVTNFNIGLTA